VNPPDGRPAHKTRHRIALIAGALLVIVLLAVTVWKPWTHAFVVAVMVVSIVWLGYLIWAIVTGRIGILHWAPTARRQRRLAGGASAEQARLEQQRLDAAMSYGSYRPTAGRAQNRDQREGSQ